MTFKNKRSTNANRNLKFFEANFLHIKKTYFFFHYVQKHYGSKKLNFVTISSTIATQMSQATGTAYAFKRKQNKQCIITYFGDGSLKLLYEYFFKQTKMFLFLFFHPINKLALVKEMRMLQ